jgi:hypothetical protein
VSQFRQIATAASARARSRFVARARVVCQACRAGSASSHAGVRPANVGHEAFAGRAGRAREPGVRVTARSRGERRCGSACRIGSGGGAAHTRRATRPRTARAEAGGCSGCGPRPSPRRGDRSRPGCRSPQPQRLPGERRLAGLPLSGWRFGRPGARASAAQEHGAGAGGEPGRAVDVGEAFRLGYSARLLLSVVMEHDQFDPLGDQVLEGGIEAAAGFVLDQAEGNVFERVDEDTADAELGAGIARRG